MKREEALRKLPARSVTTILNTLLRIKWSIEDGEEMLEPLATFLLHNGREIRGYVMDLADDGGSAWALIRVPNFEGRDPGMNLAYIEARSIAGILLENVQDVLHELSFGKIPGPVREEPLTSLELRRKAEKLSQKVSGLAGAAIAFELEWKALPKSDDGLWAVHDLVAVASGALSDIARTEDGKEALSAIRAVRFVDQKEPGAELRKDVLLIKGAFAPNEQRIARSDLRAAIEALF